MIRTAIVGLGKMGLSHLAILRTHPDLDVVGVCDSAGYLRDILAKYTGLDCYDDFDRMLTQTKADAVVVAVPSRLHAPMVERFARGTHVFCEKPFVLDVADGERLVTLAEGNQLVTQVGYHCRFIGAFQEAARIVASGALGQVHHVRAEAYGPVVLRPKGSTWRGVKAEGGGALYDYACHAIDLMNFIAGVPRSVDGVVRHSVFSRDVDDEVYCTMRYDNGASVVVRELERRAFARCRRRSRYGEPTAASSPIGRNARSICARRTPALKIWGGMDDPVHDRSHRRGLVLPSG